VDSLTGFFLFHFDNLKNIMTQNLKLSILLLRKEVIFVVCFKYSPIKQNYENKVSIKSNLLWWQTLGNQHLDQLKNSYSLTDESLMIPVAV